MTVVTRIFFLFHCVLLRGMHQQPQPVIARNAVGITTRSEIVKQVTKIRKLTVFSSEYSETFSQGVRNDAENGIWDRRSSRCKLWMVRSTSVNCLIKRACWLTCLYSDTVSHSPNSSYPAFHFGVYCPVLIFTTLMTFFFFFFKSLLWKQYIRFLFLSYLCMRRTAL